MVAEKSSNLSEVESVTVISRKCYCESDVSSWIAAF